ncbi:inner membrane protein ygjV [Klebsiella pneumoniae]|uniref:Inner membrane protein ygjV n=1 Tax=Klebsiella pneumoniae TaxID=573 RepID=A0A377VUS5_KLEPN|nr:inner membrane protein ygjV [Klebsiella pneumoniae]
MSAGLNALRTVISLRTRSLWVMTVFILLTLILGLGKLQHAMELLPIIGTVASTWALFRCKGANRPLRDVVLHRLLGHA